MKSLFGPISSFLAVALLFVSLVSASHCLGQPVESQPVEENLTEGILVLRNGNILRGKVQQQGKYYHVHLSKGKLQVREQQVEMFCQTLEEAYERRRELRVGSTADSHLELAAWCLRHDLFDSAKEELSSAESIDPGHRRLGLLQRQLKSVLQIIEFKKQQKLVEETVVPEPQPLDPARLEKAPQWARALFVRQIQPLIVHSCAAGGCHQSGNQPGTESGFHLNRLAIDGAGHPEATLRNLAATLEHIDWQAADQSDLLGRAKRAHGSDNASTPLPMHKLRVLQGWVEQLAEAHQKDHEFKTLPLLAEVAPQTPKLQLIPPLQTRPQKALAQPKSEVRTASYETKDPFDPAVFNDRYVTKEKTVAQPTVVSRVAVPLDAVPHVLVPSESVPIALPAVE